MLQSRIGKNILYAPFDSETGGGPERDPIRHVQPADLHFGGDLSTKVISSAQKFIVPVPAFGPIGEPLVYPQGHPEAGQAILNYKGQPIGERGVVFFNKKDRCWQAAPGDGSAVIIINEISPMQAELLLERYGPKLCKGDTLSLEELKEFLSYASDSLYLDDIYCSSKEFIRTRMTPASAQLAYAGEDGVYGFMKRDDRDVCEAVYISGQFTFDGPAATPQLFDNGGVIIKQGTSIHGVQPEVFERTYKLADGRAFTDARTEIMAQSP